MTLVDQPRINNIKKYLDFTKDLPGFIAEIGVYKGGTAKIIAQHSPERHLCLFDTFEGMPDSGPYDNHHRKGDFSDTSLEQVKEYLKECNNVSFYKGVFPKTVEPVKKCLFSFVHIDCDLYQSTIDALYFFGARLLTKGIIIVDDYDEPNCLGTKKAVDEYLKYGGGIISFCQSQVVLYGIGDQ